MARPNPVAEALMFGRRFQNGEETIFHHHNRTLYRQVQEARAKRERIAALPLATRQDLFKKFDKGEQEIITAEQIQQTSIKNMYSSGRGAYECTSFDAIFIPDHQGGYRLVSLAAIKASILEREDVDTVTFAYPIFTRSGEIEQIGTLTMPRQIYAQLNPTAANI